MEDVQAVVLMGGLGTRLGLVGRPKPMADVHGSPFFDYQLRLLKRWGIHRFLFLIGYMGDVVRSYYKDGRTFGVDIRYAEDGNMPKGTGGALKQAVSLLDEDFLLLYGDSFLDIDYQKMVFHYLSIRKEGRKGLMAILHNCGQLDRSNALYVPGQIFLYDKRCHSNEMEHVDYGVSILSRQILEAWDENSFDLADLLRDLSQKCLLSAHVVHRRFYEIGSPQSLEEFRTYAKQRFWRENRAVFFDRDGVINEFVFCEETEQVDSPFSAEDFHYKDGAVEVMRWLQEKGYLLFLVTNQPAAAKGKVSLEKIYSLHEWLMKDLYGKGVHLEFIQMCPHHPTGTLQTMDHFLIQECNCRKPKAGLITDILSVYRIDKKHSYLIGDSYTDIIAAQRSGIKSVLLGSLKCDACHRLKENKPDWVIEDLREIKNIVYRG